MTQLKFRKLGILTFSDVDDSPPPPVDTYNFPDWFDYPIEEIYVPGAHSDLVVNDLADLTENYVLAARELVRRGVTAITSDCGFTVVYQQALAAAVSVPVACSALLQVPLLANLVPSGGALGLLTFDADNLSERHLACAGYGPGMVPLAIKGIQGTQAWRNWVGDPVNTDWRDFDRVVLQAALALVRENPSITHILLECHGFPRCAPAIRNETGLPVFDWVSQCDWLMAGAARR